MQTGGRQYVAATVRALPHPEAYLIAAAPVKGRRAIVVASQTEVGTLYGAFRLLRELQTQRTLARILLADAPKVALRVLDHWDNLDRTVERGYAGRSLWAWDSLPAHVSPRYRDYARASASIGINGAVLTNVNANARVLTPGYLVKVAAIANVLRPYGIRTYLTARFSAPVEIGGLKTADPLDSAVARWWRDKAAEIHRHVPDFGGFVVKANSEGQPGPQQYGRTHADGANMLADAVKPFGGVVMWRAFVYASDVPTDRIRQAYDEFQPLDGKFRDNVLAQVKNGPLDFQPREPFHPLFGAMPRTPLMLELQVTKEYLGQDTHLAYLAPLWEEVLRADTHAKGAGSTVARVVDGTLDGHRLTGIAGVANVGTDRDWTGSHFNQANWYAFGRLAWNPELASADVAEEWVRATFSNDSLVVARVTDMMRVSREAVVNYTGPLGLAHLMATGHHYGPGPWADAGRADWNPRYYHRADTLGIGFDRTTTGSNAVAQYAPPVRDRYASLATVPDSLLLWFHHVPWTYRVPSTGRTVWDELVARYDAGVDTVRAMRRTWDSLAGRVDPARFRDVRDFLAIQEREARWWRDASLSYFRTFSGRPLPRGTAAPAHPLDWYQRITCPADPTRPRCPAVY
jgi:alpha-glucuronidase